MSDAKSAKATIAEGIIEEVILGQFLIDGMPKSNKLCLKEIYKYTGYNYYSLRKYIVSDLYTIKRKSIEITNDKQLLSIKSKEYVERLIKKAVFPAKYEHDPLIYYTMKLFDSSYFSEEEKAFIDLMNNELFSIINFKDFSTDIPPQNMLEFNLINHNYFYLNVRKVFNDIIRKKLHAGDNIMAYFDTDNLTALQIADMLAKAEKYDLFFDKFGILKCDLEKNRNILIKNFINTVLYDFYDITARCVLLLKLNTKYPFLIRDKVFDDFG